MSFIKDLSLLDHLSFILLVGIFGNPFQIFAKKFFSKKWWNFSLEIQLELFKNFHRRPLNSSIISIKAFVLISQNNVQYIILYQMVLFCDFRGALYFKIFPQWNPLFWSLLPFFQNLVIQSLVITMFKKYVYLFWNNVLSKTRVPWRNTEKKN